MMKLQLEWTRPIPLRDASRENLIYKVALPKLPDAAGVYVFGRQFGNRFEALYVGKADRIRFRVRDQLANLRIMVHLKNAKTGKRIVLGGALSPNRASRLRKAYHSSSALLFDTFCLKVMISPISRARVFVATRYRHRESSPSDSFQV